MSSIHRRAMITALLSCALMCSASRAETTPVPLTREAAMAAAIAASPSLAVARARVEQARARVRQAQAGYWPTLGGSLSYARVDPADTAAAGLAVLGEQDLFSLQAQATWQLFNGFTTRFASLAARTGREQSGAALAEAHRQLLAAVGSAFHSAQLARENMAIARADLDFNQRLADEADARQRAGMGSLSDALNFQVRVNQARAARLRSERGYAVSLIGLASLMAFPEATPPEGMTIAPLEHETETEMTPPATNGLLAAALRLRPDLRAVELERRRAEAEAGAARGALYPTASLEAAATAERADDPGFASEDLGYSVGAAINYRFSDGGRRRGVLQEARARQSEASYAGAARQLEVAAEIETAVARVSEAQAQVTLQRENLQLVERVRDLVEREYDAGQGTLVRLNEAQRDLVGASVQLAEALTALRTAWLDLRAATGEILDEFEVEP